MPAHGAAACGHGQSGNLYLTPGIAGGAAGQVDPRQPPARVTGQERSGGGHREGDDGVGGRGVGTARRLDGDRHLLGVQARPPGSATTVSDVDGVNVPAGPVPATRRSSRPRRPGRRTGPAGPTRRSTPRPARATSRSCRCGRAVGGPGDGPHVVGRQHGVSCSAWVAASSASCALCIHRPPNAIAASTAAAADE